MLLLKSVKKTDVEAYKQYRLQVKRRLYRHNEEVLASMEPDEMKKKLHETFLVVEEGYREILRAI
jgi:histone acetyltransferase 1